MTEPTTPPTATTPPTESTGVSRSDFGVRLEALHLAVKAMEHAPYFPSELGAKSPSIHAIADEEGLAVLAIAERFRVFLEGGA